MGETVVSSPQMLQPSGERLPEEQSSEEQSNLIQLSVTDFNHPEPQMEPNFQSCVMPEKFVAKAVLADPVTASLKMTKTKLGLDMNVFDSGIPTCPTSDANSPRQLLPGCAN